MSKISELSDGGSIQSGDTLIAVRSGGNVKVTYGGTTTANIDGGTIDGTVIGGSSAAAITGTTITGTSFVSSGDMTFGDNDKAVFGAGSDLQIYHDGSNSYVQDAGDGALILNTTNGGGVYVYSAGETMATFNSNGAVNLYYDNAAKLATTSTGIAVTGTASADQLNSNNGKLFLDDNGSHNGVINAPASLYVNFDSDNTSASEKIVFGYDRDGTSGGTSVMEISSTGIDVTGTVTADGLTVDAVNSNFQSTGATSISLVDTDVGNDAFKFNIENGGRDGRISVWQDIILSNTGGTLARFDNGGSISFYEDTGTTAKFYWDASAQRLDVQAVGADAADSTALRLSQNNFSAGGTTLIKFGTENTTWSKGAIGFERTGDFDKGALIFCTNNATSTTDVSSSDERMRIDSSGNLLVGTTSANPTGNSVAGASIDASGEGNFSVDGAEALRLNRKTSDGDIARFFKDGTTVGSIGTEASDGTTPADLVITAGTINAARLWLKGGDSGLILDGNTNSVLPTDENSYEDNRTDLGSTSYRFKDLYLSGGVYLGGTGAANHLDDYEEGTWTPVVAGSSTAGSYTYSNGFATYTKVGRKVTIGMYITAITESSAGSGYIVIGGLPFPKMADAQFIGAIRTEQINLGTSNTSAIVEFTGASSSVSKLYIRGMQNNASGSDVNISGLNSGSSIIGLSITYFTS